MQKTLKMPELTEEQLVRFWKAVDKCSEDQCWEWLNVPSNGYGHIQINDKIYKAHRIAYKIHHGIDPGDLLVCHKCDNPICVNPNHLFLGTQMDNIQDSINKGRIKRGKNHRLAKLTEEIVLKIFACKGLECQAKTANRFNTTTTTIQTIQSGRSWCWLTKCNDYDKTKSRARLKENQVREIRQLRVDGQTIRHIAEIYNMSYQNIWCIIRRETWKNII